MKEREYKVTIIPPKPGRRLCGVNDIPDYIFDAFARKIVAEINEEKEKEKRGANNEKGKNGKAEKVG